MNSQRWMSRQFFNFYMTWGIFLPFWTGWMIQTKGVSISEASLIMSLGLIARGLSTLVAYPYLSLKFSSKALLNMMAIGTLIAILFYIPVSSFNGLLMVTLLINVIYPTLMPALDSAAGILVQSNQLKDYGKSRSWGSIGFVAAGIILTFFTGMLGDEVILYGLLLGMLVFLFFGFLQAPVVLSAKPKTEHAKNHSIRELFRINHFGLVLVIVILLQSAHASYYNYGYLFLQEIHAPKYLIGVILNIAVIAEIIFFSIADRMFNKFSAGFLLVIAALGSTLRWILVFAFPNVIVFCLAQTLHSLSFAMGHYAFMKYLVRNIPHTHIPKAQGVYSALALGWGTAVFTMFGGYLFEIEPRYAFIGMIACSIPSMLLALIYQKTDHKQQEVAVIN
ncbi:MFS transporter [Bacillus sp. T33-2]|uniref:MFS transporter n=1 Tax=Bacillus sp. T33-2 TaxID=2054168 RepID=UPI000C76159B|nr:MFS transporter [Bacillus sp. T33-2]PLR94646.1 MFS transporter [Bacillus sp. T33-2]